MRNAIIVAPMLFVVVLLLLPVGYEAVWDGRFDLTVIVDTSRSIDESSLLFATCWNEREAAHAIQNPSSYEYGFHPPRTNGNGELLIEVPCSGREGAYGFRSTYHQPRFLVVEYNTDDKLQQPSRMRFSIPEGRGPRTMKIEIP